tara:strand:+ start:4789 stop:5694 length:906 start_codon:yes stop_codon:yes gene_type:complete
MKILILGLNSQISKTIHKKIGTKKMKKYDFLFLDRKYMNKKSLSTEIKKYKPNTIINTTVFHPVDDCEKYINKSKKINVLLIKDLINIFKYQKINPLFIHISSDYVFEGNPKKLAYTDNAYRNPINVLGNHKKQSEDLILKYYKNGIIIRTSWLFSEFNKNFVTKIFNKLINNNSLKVVSNQFGNPTSTNSLVNFIFDYLLIKKKVKYKINTYNFCNFPSVSWHIFAETIFNLMYKNKLIKKNLYVDEISSEEIIDLNYLAKRPKNSSLLIDNINRNFKKYKPIYWYNELETVIKSITKDY